MSLRIYVIDDSNSFLAGLKAILEVAAYEVKTFAQPTNALVSIEKDPPDVLICDLHMPDINGFEVIRRIRQDINLTTLPILLMTGSNESEAMEKAIRIGADGFCPKETIRQMIIPQILALLRLRDAYRIAIKGKQLEAVQALIGTYKHEINNALTIMDGSIIKLNKEISGFAEHASSEKLRASFDRIAQTVRKLDALRSYEEENYGESDKILKLK